MKNTTKYKGKLNVLGGNIRLYRNKNNLSLENLSTKLLLIGIDIPKNSLQRLENGDRVIKDFELGAICKVLNISASELFKTYINELDS